MVCVLLADHRGTDMEMERVMHIYSDMCLQFR